MQNIKIISILVCSIFFGTQFSFVSAQATGGDLYGPATGGDLYGPASGGDFYGPATGGDLYGYSDGGDLYGYADSGDLYGPAFGGDLYGYSTGGDLYYSSTGGDLYGPATGADLYGYSGGGDLYGSASGGDLYGPATGGDLYGYSDGGDLYGYADTGYYSDQYYQGQTNSNPYYGGGSNYGANSYSGGGGYTRPVSYGGGSYGGSSYGGGGYGNSASPRMNPGVSIFPRPSNSNPYINGGAYNSYPVYTEGEYSNEYPTYANPTMMGTGLTSVYTQSYSMNTAPVAVHTSQNAWTTDYSEYVGLGKKRTGSVDVATDPHVSLEQTDQLALSAIPYTGIDEDPLVSGILYCAWFAIVVAGAIRLMTHYAETSHQ